MRLEFESFRADPLSRESAGDDGQTPGASRPVWNEDQVERPFMLSDGPSAATLQPSQQSRTALSPRDQLIFRLFDCTVASVLLLLLAPVLIGLALLVKLSTGGPVLFKHRRIGRGGVEFGCLKFRTMVPDADRLIRDLLATSERFRFEWQSGQKLLEDPRITPVGRILRRYSLDELPQLLNVLRGEMSIVGPRPIVEEEVVRYGPSFAAYCSVRPGLTGLWQVSGRNSLPYAERVRLDALYAETKCLRGDLAICLRTIPVVVFARGC
jgi:lipopolysaccharide/colanic/teichoic acid biosynthesis glycosyltransferase